MMEINLLDDEKPGDFYPLWAETRSMPFRRSPYPAHTFEMAIGRALGKLHLEATMSEKAADFLHELEEFITLEDERRMAGYRWAASAGLWLEEHPRAAAWNESGWRGRSRVKRLDFSSFWEVRLAPYLVDLQYRETQ